MFVYFFLFFYSPNHASLRLTLNSLLQALTSLSHLLSKLSLLCLTAANLTRSSMSLPIEARRHWPTSWPTLSNSHAADSPQTQAIDLPPIHFFDALNSLKLTSLSRHRRSTPPTRLAFRWVASVFFIYMLGIFIWVCVCIYKYRINKF